VCPFELKNKHKVLNMPAWINVKRFVRRSIINRGKIKKVNAQIAAIEKVRDHSIDAINETNAKRAAERARGPIGAGREEAFDRAKNRRNGPRDLRDDAIVELMRLRTELNRLRGP